MELEEMKAKWEEYDRKLDMGIRQGTTMNRRFLNDAHTGRARAALRRMAFFQALEALINLAAVVALGEFIYRNISDMRFALPGVALDVFAIALLATGIRQIVAALQVDYGMPIAAVQKQVEALRILRVRTVRWIFVLAALAWTPLLIVSFKALGIDVYRAFGPAYLFANLLLGLAVIPLALWTSARFGDRLAGYPAVQRFLRDLAGRNLVLAKESLAALAAFEMEV